MNLYWYGESYFFSEAILSKDYICGFSVSKDSSVIIVIDSVTYKVGNNLNAYIEVLNKKYPNSFGLIYINYQEYFKSNKKKKKYLSLTIELTDQFEIIYKNPNPNIYNPLIISVTIRFTDEIITDIFTNYYIE